MDIAAVLDDLSKALRPVVDTGASQAQLESAVKRAYQVVEEACEEFDCADDEGDDEDEGVFIDDDEDDEDDEGDDEDEDD